MNHTIYLLIIILRQNPHCFQIFTKQFIKLTVEKHRESVVSISFLREMARFGLNTVMILKDQTSQQEEISSRKNFISENQAAALNEISASLDNFVINAISATETMPSLYEKMNLTLDCANDLKDFNDSPQIKEILTTLLSNRALN